MNTIDKIVVKYLLSTNEPGKVFFASLLTLIKKQESNITPTMGVTIIDGQLYLLYNPDFVDTLIKTQGVNSLKGVLEHELLHIVYEHLNKVKKFNRIPSVYNMATDVAINQLIKDDIMPKKIITEVIDKNGKAKQVKSGLLYPELFNLPRGKDSEWYYNELLKNAQKVKCSGQGQQGSSKDDKDKDGGGGSSLDDHNLWDKIKENEQMVKEVVKRAVQDAYENAKKLRGFLPSNLEEQIKELLKPPTIDWRHLLRQYIGASIKTGFKSSWKRPNRRFFFSEEFKGKVSNRTIRILLAVDTSGSVSNEDFQDFMSEMKGLLNVYKCQIDLVQCDAMIQKAERLRPYSNLHIKFKGRGGTDFKPVFDYLKDHIEYDLLIYFTDLYCDFKGCSTYRNVIWVTTRGYDKNNKVPFGRVVHITDKEDDNE